MVQSLNLGGSPTAGTGGQNIRRLNRLPIIIAVVLVVVFLGVIFYGLTSRGLFRNIATSNVTGGPPASTFADAMKRGVNDGSIGDQPPTVIVTPPAAEEKPPQQNPFTPPPIHQTAQAPQLEPDSLWRARAR